MAKRSGRDKYLDVIRNIGIIAHIDAGKTTLTERMLYYAKKIHRLGEVHEGTATMDYMPEEQERGITITSACTTCHWRDEQINIIDTPGHVDFTIEVERSLRVLDGAVGVFCAVGGVEPQSETVWRQSEHYHVPKLAFINKLDRIGADFPGVVREIREKLGANPLVLEIPEGSESGFRGVIDLVNMEFLQFDPQSRGAEVSSSELSDGQRQRAEPWRDELVEKLAELDETLLEKYVGGQTITPEEMRGVIRRATLGLQGVPVFAGSALKNIGVQPLLDGICSYLPSPLEVAQAQGIDPQTKKKKSFPVSSDAPLSALVFKVSVESGRLLTLMRIYSGRIAAGEQAYNATQGVMQRVARLFTLHADRKERLDEAGAGQIVAAAGLKQSRTGDTFCRKEDPIILEQISKYQPVISLALEPRNSEEEEKLLEALNKMLQEDPTLSLQRDEDTEQIILSGMGELHLDIVQERLRREHKVDLRSGRPQVVYRETVGGSARAEEEFDRELGDVRHYGRVALLVEPVARDRENQIIFDFDVSQWPREWIDSVYDGVESGLQSGVLRGYPVQGVRVRIQAMHRNPEASSDAGYHMAATGALKKAMDAATPLLMEPVMRVEVFVPEDFVGDVVSLVGTKGGRIENMFDRGGGKVVQALAPLRMLFGFSTELRSATQGRGNFMMKFDRFDVLE
jgi:elongation factor G